MNLFNSGQATNQVVSANEQFFNRLYPDIRVNSNFGFVEPFMREMLQYGEGIKAITLNFTALSDYEPNYNNEAFKFLTIEPEVESATLNSQHKTVYNVSYYKNQFQFRNSEEAGVFLAQTIKTLNDGYILTMKRIIQSIFGVEFYNYFNNNLQQVINTVKSEFDQGRSVKSRKKDLLSAIRKVSFDLSFESEKNTFSPNKENFSYVDQDEQVVVMSYNNYDRLLKIPNTVYPDDYKIPAKVVVIPGMGDDKVFVGDPRVINIYPQYYETFTEFNSRTLQYNLILHSWERIGVLGIFAGKIISVVDDNTYINSSESWNGEEFN